MWGYWTFILMCHRNRKPSIFDLKKRIRCSETDRTIRQLWWLAALLGVKTELVRVNFDRSNFFLSFNLNKGTWQLKNQRDTFCCKKNDDIYRKRRYEREEQTIDFTRKQNFWTVIFVQLQSLQNVSHGSGKLNGRTATLGSEEAASSAKCSESEKCLVELENLWFKQLFFSFLEWLELKFLTSNLFFGFSEARSWGKVSIHLQRVGWLFLLYKNNG